MFFIPVYLTGAGREAGAAGRFGVTEWGCQSPGQFQPISTSWLIFCVNTQRGAAMVTSQAKAEQQGKGLVDFEQNLEHESILVVQIQ